MNWHVPGRRELAHTLSRQVQQFAGIQAIAVLARLLVATLSPHAIPSAQVARHLPTT